MAQVTIYMENSLEEKVKQMAKDTGVSISKFIASSLEKNLDNSWSKDVKNLQGSWGDFPSVEEIRDEQTQDIKREEF